MLVPVLCSLAAAVYDDKLPDAVNTVGVMAVSALCLGGADYIGLGRTTMDELDSFAKVLLPTLTAVTGAGGAVTSAAAKYAAASLFLEILMHIGNTVILPLICAFMAASVGSAAFGGLESAVKLTKWAVTTLLTLLVLIFTLYISVTGIISGSADQAAVKAAKTAMSLSMPVVGGMLSDAASAVANGTLILRNTVGVTGMAAVLAVCAVPFLRLGLRHMVFKAVAALTEPIGGERLAKLIGNIGTAMGMLMGLCGAMAVMLYITIISMMKAVV
jgi:stage III sporulation protein AE